ncbi:VOC family protein [Streptomyces sp. NBC_01537]|uniref:VOC family protein n=1 Tax=Streptomyces sp. NBC_01537 TaxID=2903896 RepID=UPI00386E5AC1
MIGTLYCVVIDCPDPLALAVFYQRMLGWELDDSDPISPSLTSENGMQIGFQIVGAYRAPLWPDPDRPQQFHLDFDAGTLADVEAKHEQVVAWGAAFVRDSGGRQKGFRVFSDPAGHPFCLCWRADAKGTTE